jgi:hypothetical protein
MASAFILFEEKALRSPRSLRLIFLPSSPQGIQFFSMRKNKKEAAPSGTTPSLPA